MTERYGVSVDASHTPLIHSAPISADDKDAQTFCRRRLVLPALLIVLVITFVVVMIIETSIMSDESALDRLYRQFITDKASRTAPIEPPKPVLTQTFVNRFSSAPFPSVAAMETERAKSDATCSQRMGRGLVTEWTSASHAQEMCSSRSDGGGRLVCYSMNIPSMPVKTPPHSFCVSNRTFVDFALMSKADAPKHRAHYFMGTREHFRMGKGTFKAHCKMTEQYDLALISADHQRDIIDAFDGEQNSAPPAVTASAKTLLVVVREGNEHSNLFHTMTDLLNAFTALSAHAIDIRTVQLLLLDAHPKSPFDTLWQSVYSPNHPVLRPDALIASDANTSPSKLYAETVLYVAPGYSSPLYIHLTEDDQCKAQVDIILDFAQFILNAYEIVWQHFTPATSTDYKIVQTFTTASDVARLEAAGLSRDRIVHIVLISRRPYTAFVDHKKIHRRILNEETLLDFIKTTPAPNARTSSASASLFYANSRVTIIDFAQLNFSAQLSVLSSADILIGMHGAALSHAFFLPPWSALIELHPINQNWHCFEHMTEWRGLSYSAWRNTHHQAEREDDIGSGVEVNREELSDILQRVYTQTVERIARYAHWTRPDA